MSGQFGVGTTNGSSATYFSSQRTEDRQGGGAPRATAYGIMVAALVLAASITGLAAADPPTLKTDKPNHQPGENVIFTGQNWAPGESVTITLNQGPDVLVERAFPAVADDDGNVVNTDLVLEEADLEDTLIATAVGNASAATASVVVHDPHGLVTAESARGGHNTPPGLAEATFDRHADSNEPISVVITLDLRDHAGVDALLAAQHDPTSPQYHQWITPEEFQARFGPLPEDLQAAADFLAAQGFTNITQLTSTMIAGEGSVGHAERAFQVAINHHGYHGRSVFSNDRDPVLPPGLAKKIVRVGGLDNLTMMYPTHRPPAEADPNYLYPGNGLNYMLPRDNQVAYGEKAGYFDLGKKGTSGAELAVASSFDIALADVNDQLTRQGGAAAGYNLLTSSGSGPHTVSSTCVPNTGSGTGCGFVNGTNHESLETIWDVSLASSVANDNHIGVYLAQTQLTTAFGVVYQYLADRASTIKVVTHSWGLCLSSMPPSDVIADDNAFAQAAAGGQAWFVATGDAGSSDCTGGGTNPSVDYPAASPYVTGAGGSEQNSLAAGTFGGDGWMTGYPANGETACTNGGGGEATTGPTEPRPVWQTGSGVPAGTKRLVPDVSMHYGVCGTDTYSKQYLVMIGGSLFTVAGTSGDAPQWAGYWAVGNQVVGQNLGFAAPTVFRILRNEGGTSYANSFHDVTTGNNGAFSATTGYDRATGVGTPKFNGLYPDLVNLFTPTYGTLQGTVTDSSTSSPISGATVTAGANSTTTNGSGFYQFASILVGTYNVTASAAGYNSSTASGVTVTNGGTTTQNFALSPNLSACLTDTTQADFQAGTATNLDLTTSAGNVLLTHTGGENVDQQNQNLSTSGFGFTNIAWAGQTFTPTVTGTLTRLDLNLFCSGCSGTNPNITVSIRNTSGDLPTGADLATATIPGFSSGAGIWYTATFGTPTTVTAGTRYAYVFRLVSARTTGTQAYTVQTPSVYANGRRATSANSGSTWTGDSTRDLGFIEYVTTPLVYSGSGNLVSSLKDSNPLPTGTPHWTSLSWTATKPANTNVQFQLAASSSSSGPFNFVGPDGTGATFFTTSPASPSSSFFSGRYLKYKAYLSNTVNTVTPTLSDVTVCYNNTCFGLANGTTCNDLNACTTGDTCQSGTCTGTAIVCSASDQCHNAGTCDTGTGLCSNPAKPNGTSCSDGNACTTSDTCQSGACTSGSPVVCTALDQCHDAGTCDTGTGLCSDPAKAAGSPCGSIATSNCDNADSCNGSGACVANNVANSTSCDDGNACTTGDFCSNGVCAGVDTSAVDCDDGNGCTDDFCDTQTGCYHEDNADPCDDGHACTINDRCADGECHGTLRFVGCVECTHSDQCDDENACTTDTCEGGICVFTNKAAGTTCGDPSSGECDDADTCDSTGNCLANYKPATTTCGDTGTECTNQDYCDGSGGCTDNGFQAAGTACGSSTDTECTSPDTCDGAGACLANDEPVTTTCGDAGTECTNQDYCDGSGGCTDNGFQAAGTACGSSADTECTNPDTCNGAGACQTNDEPVTTTCGDAGTECTNQDYCNGSGDCTDNGYKLASTSCGDPSDTECTNPDTCNGLGNCLANHEPADTNCGDGGTECTNQDKCNGSGSCTDNGFKAGGTACGDHTSGQCDDADTCNGSGSCQANHKAAGTFCGDAEAQCVYQDTCDGSGNCHDNGFKPSSTACNEGNICTQTDLCSGNSAACLGTNYAWTGVLPPINIDGSSIHKLGSTVPTKFRLTGPCAGSGGLTYRIFIAKITNSVLGTEQEAVSTSAADNGNTFRTADGQYIFNLATKVLSQGTWQIRIAQYSGNTELVTLGAVNVSLKP